MCGGAPEQSRIRLTAAASATLCMYVCAVAQVLNPGIEIGLAWLLEAGHIGVADIWLFSRVIEDTVDTQGPHNAHRPVCTQHSMPLTAVHCVCYRSILCSRAHAQRRSSPR